MFYISSFVDDNKIGVTDTRDWVEEFVTNKDIVKLVEGKKADIYGVDVFNHKANCTPLTVDIQLKKSELLDRLRTWKEVHNKWNARPVEDYLACAKIGTRIEIDYVVTADADGRKSNAHASLEKKSWELWIHEDTHSTFSGRSDDSRYAAWVLDVTCLGCRLKHLEIK